MKIFLSIALILAVSEATFATSDVCPPPKNLAGTCQFEPNGEGCTSDSDCSNGRVCCSDHCGKKCVLPITAAKPEIPAKGVCPAPSPFPGPCVYKPGCFGDSSCPGAQLCCKEGCNRVCKDPVPKKPKSGVCPAPSPFPGPCLLIPGCFGDDSCPGEQLCCKEGCNRVCKDPVPEKSTKSGVCPAPSPFPGPCVHQPGCFGDDSCPGEQLCCKEGCNRVCKDPVPKKPKSGVCPAPSPFPGPCVHKPGCLGDDFCPGAQLCCKEGCNRVCKDPVPEKPKVVGVCPAPSPFLGPCVFNPEVNCVGDDSCPHGQLCCKDGCGSICKDPVQEHPGYCPFNFLPPWFCQRMGRRPLPSTCFVDTDCSASMKCCQVSCHRTCVRGQKAMFLQ